VPAETLVLHNEPGADLGGIDIKNFLEKSIGNSSEAATVDELGGPLGNPKAAAYVDAIGQKLVSNTNRKDFGFKFDIVKNNTPNAFALPNGSVYITDGLLRLLKTESQLANVLGHEVSHVTKHHTLGQIKVNLIAKLGIEGAGALLNGLFSKSLSNSFNSEDQKAMKDMGFNLITSGYSRADESEADEVGQGLASRSGWSPTGMVDLMKIFLTLEKGEPKGIEAYMRSHPYSGDRVKEAEKRLSSLSAGGEIGEEPYRTFLEKVLNISPSETKLTSVQKALRFVPGASEAQARMTAAEGSGLLIPALVIGGVTLVIVLVIILRRK
jgi:predicted Zn-dependent protease